jgi:hypothetical protein
VRVRQPTQNRPTKGSPKNTKQEKHEAKAKENPRGGKSRRHRNEAASEKEVVAHEIRPKQGKKKRMAKRKHASKSTKVKY